MPDLQPIPVTGVDTSRVAGSEPKIFISYRRSDSQEVSELIARELATTFGDERVFHDLETGILPGRRYGEYLQSLVKECGVLLAIIGDNWLAELHARADDPDAEDWVRIEIRTALRTGRQVVPVLVGRASMPGPAELPDDLQGLAGWQAHELRSGSDLGTEVVRLSGALREMVAKAESDALASQLHEVQNLLAGFIRASLTALDRRDPTASGSSVRVAELVCELATLCSEQSEGPFAEVVFSPEDMTQLRYAALLKDVGMVGVRESLLLKEGKLPPAMAARVLARFDLIRKTLEADAAEARLEATMSRGSRAARTDLERIDTELADALRRTAQYQNAVREADHPRPLEKDLARTLREIAGTTFTHPSGDVRPYLTSRELEFLLIESGNLAWDERQQVESHVRYSYDFLLDIPWPESFSRIAEIARGHHERLDGSGYPDGVTGEFLALETRLLMVCDVFDSLTASDRPHRRAWSVADALDHLRAEASKGTLDADVVALFVESRVYQKILDLDWREF